MIGPILRKIDGAISFWWPNPALRVSRSARARPSINVDGVSELYAEPDAILIRISLQG